MLSLDELTKLRAQVVRIRNNSKRTIALPVSGKSDYMWTSYNQIQVMPFIDLETVIYSNAGRSIFMDGLLVIEEGAQIYEALSLPVKAELLITEKQAVEILSGTYKQLEQALYHAPKANKDLLWQTALNKRLIDVPKNALFEEYCGIDILNAIQAEEKFKEPEKTTAPIKTTPKTGTNSL